MRNILLPYSANLISLRSVLTLRNVVTPNSIFYQRLLIRQLGLWMTSKDHLFKCPNRLSKQQNKGGQSWNLNYPNVDSRYLKALQSINFQILRFHFLPPTCTDWFCQKVQILKTGYYLVRIFMQSLPTPLTIQPFISYVSLQSALWKSIILHHIPHLTPLFCIKTKPDTPSSQVSYLNQTKILGKLK